MLIWIPTLSYVIWPQEKPPKQEVTLTDVNDIESQKSLDLCIWQYKHLWLAVDDTWFIG